jgi:RimJ/RimL family protein N-acetyltransferase
VNWLADDRPVGFSTSDKIRYGEQANMHLHVTDPERRNQGLGAECVRRSVDIYFERLKLKRLFCEPNAFNVGPIARCRRPASNNSRPHDGSRPAQFSPARHPLGDRALKHC